MMGDKRDKFCGLFPAVISPMDAAGNLNEDPLRRVLEWNVREGANGFWLAGGTGESVLLDDDENRRIATAAVEQVAGRAINIMHVGSPTTRRSEALAEHAAKAGVDAICCVPPFFYRRSDAEIVEHYRIVAAAADLPLFVYNLPGMTGVEITADLMRKIQDRVPQLTGLKHSSANMAVVHEFAQMGLACFIGSSALMLPAMAVGAVGCVDGPPLVEPRVWLEIYAAYHRGDREAAEAAQRRARELLPAVVGLGGERFLASMKAVMSHRLGIDCGDPRPPGAPLTEAERAQVVATAEGVGLGRVG